MNIRMGDAYDDYMASHSAKDAAPLVASTQSTGFWSAVGNLLTNRGVVQVRQKQPDKMLAYGVLALTALGVLYVGAKT